MPSLSQISLAFEMPVVVLMNLGSLLASSLVDTGCNLNVRKTIRRLPGRLLNVLRTFNLRPVCKGSLTDESGEALSKYCTDRIFLRI